MKRLESIGQSRKKGLDVQLSNIKLCDSNYVKCNALKEAGISISTYPSNERTKYIVSIEDMPDADKCIETEFPSINDIILAFRDRLRYKGYKVA